MADGNAMHRETAREEYWYRRGMVEQFQSDSANPDRLDSLHYEGQLTRVMSNALAQVADKAPAYYNS